MPVNPLAQKHVVVRAEMKPCKCLALIPMGESARHCAVLASTGEIVGDIPAIYKLFSRLCNATYFGTLLANNPSASRETPKTFFGHL